MFRQLGPKILIVENQMIVAADISLQFSKLGYEVIGINTRAEDALKTIEINRPDIVLMNIALQQKNDGVETACFIKEAYNIPVVFLSTNTDETLLKRVMDVKPFEKMDLKRGIESVLNRMTLDGLESSNKRTVSYYENLFIRQKEQLIKVQISNILFIEANRNYCKVITKRKKYRLTVPLKKLEDQLPEENFIRVHRSYLVNLLGISSIQEHGEFLTIMDYQIPISRRLRRSVLEQIRQV